MQVFRLYDFKIKHRILLFVKYFPSVIVLPSINKKGGL